MDGWKSIKYSDFVDINPLVSLKGGEKYSFVEMKDLNPSNKYVTPSDYKLLKGGARFKNQDTLFARITPCLENGKICQVKGLINDVGFGSTEFLVFRGKEKISDSDFVFYLSRTDEVRRFAEQNMIGTSGRQRVNKNAFDNLFVVVPTLAKQKSIASILSSLDYKIELNRKMNQTLEQMAQAIFKHWFVDFEFPISAEMAATMGKPDLEGKPYKSSGGEMVESEIGYIPRGWEVSTLGDVGSFKNGVNYGREESGDSSYSILNVRNIVANSQVIKKDLDFLSIDKRKAAPYYVNQFDLLIVRSASPGVVSGAIRQIENLIYSGFIIKYSLNNKADFCFMFYLLKRLKSELDNLSNGTTLKNINQEVLKANRFKKPPQALINSFKAITLPILELIYQNEQESYTLSEIRDSILPKLMSGQLTIKQAEQLV